eukprot:gb/GEZN01025507.1/.p2 GENE.gb/GEZN01025507.1/~~gb/GEZN01025507.1/.p2  ORF type:complete len:132 (-),score=26.36 gb/GEZN01025507.1/:148-543(-)
MQGQETADRRNQDYSINHNNTPVRVTPKTTNEWNTTARRGAMAALVVIVIVVLAGVYINKAHLQAAREEESSGLSQEKTSANKGKIDAAVGKTKVNKGKPTDTSGDSDSVPEQHKQGKAGKDGKVDKEGQG